MGEASDKLLKGKLALVTGGGSGIGRAICNIFARDGATVVVADINQTTGQETLNNLEHSLNHMAQSVDVADSNSITQLFDAIHKRYRKYPEVVVNCAGIAIFNSILETTEKEFDKLVAVNLKGTFLVAQAAMRKMIADKISHGSIINVSSITAKKYFSDIALYACTKSAVSRFTKDVAVEMADFGIRCNAILPGVVDTPLTRSYLENDPKNHECMVNMVPLKRMALPEEIAETCAFLASDKSSYITGAEIIVAGGL